MDQRARNGMTQADARSTTSYVLAAGVVVMVAGAIIAVLNRPRTTLDLTGSASDAIQHHGSVFGMWIGLGIAGVGQLLVLVAVVAFGVRLGIAGAVWPAVETMEPTPKKLSD